MSDSVQPHRRQPTRLPRPWDSPGKNTGVGGHFLLQCMKVKSKSEVAQSCPTLSDPMDCSLPGSSAHGIFQARVLEWGAIALSETTPVISKRPDSARQRRWVSSTQLVGAALYIHQISAGRHLRKWPEGFFLPKETHHWFESNLRWVLNLKSKW